MRLLDERTHLVSRVARRGEDQIRSVFERAVQSGADWNAIVPSPGLRCDVGKDPRGVNSVGARGFEPPTFCSQNYPATIAGGVNDSQPSEMITEPDPSSVQPSQRSQIVVAPWVTG